MLPLDKTRCHPKHADFWCKQCQRYADHPGQTWGQSTPSMRVLGSEDEACQYIPINIMEKMK